MFAGKGDYFEIEAEAAMEHLEGLAFLGHELVEDPDHGTVVKGLEHGRKGADRRRKQVGVEVANNMVVVLRPGGQERRHRLVERALDALDS